MPVYNREALVADAIRSIQNQTLKDWDLLILDDASTDKTLQVCRAFEAEDKRIHVFVNERNIGCGESRNRLLGHAKGEYIAIQDSDDVSIPERFALELEVLKSKPEIDLVSGIAAWVDLNQGHVLSKYPPYLCNGRQYPQDRSEMIRLLMYGCEVSVTTCMFRSSLVKGITEPFGRYRLVDDWYFFLKIAQQAQMWGIPDVLVDMKRGKNHAHLWSDSISALKEAQKMKKEIYEYYKRMPDSPINYWRYRRSVAISLTVQGRYLGGWKGYLKLVQSFLWDPFYRKTHKSLREFTGRAIRKRKHLAVRSSEGG
jgi:glycosyltransferase involved in cell wall biosynthesis